jgi:glucosyl-3-phosphoglycerate phosphatase
MFLIRHGESEFNRHFAQTGRDPGIRDAPLTKRGNEQAEAAARHFLQLKNNPGRMKAPKRILSSPYTRALQTATPIAKALNLSIEVIPLLGERRLYSCDEGTPLCDLKKSWETYDFSRLEKEEWWPPKHESDEDIAGRVRAFLALENGGNDDTLIVSHWYFIFTLSELDCDNGQTIWRDEKGRFHRQPA